VDFISKALDRAKDEKGPRLREWVMPGGEAGARRSDPGTGQAEVESFSTRAPDLDWMARSHMLTTHDTDNQILADHFRLLRTRVRQKMGAKRWTKLGITSAAAKAGKTFTAVNLAVTMARSTEDDVFLLDCDARNPSIARALGLEVEAGLIDFLAGDVEMEDIAFAVDGLENLKVVPGRVNEEVHERFELITSPRMQEVLNALAGYSQGATVIVDMPPVLVGDEVVGLAPMLDSFLFVVRDAVTDSDKLKSAVEMLKDFEILGVVLNDSEESLNHYAGYAYGTPRSDSM
jgi:Mrp family chromosome partitioning ATPase